MSNDVAIISAAGYRALSETIEGMPFMTPEPLLSIGEKYGGTILGRQARQLRDLGFFVFITAGQPGCKFPNRVSAMTERRKVKVHPDCLIRSPWTWKRIEQIREYGVPILVSSPDDYSYHDSFCRAIDAIGYDWNRLFMSCGDHLYTDTLLADLMNLPTPRQVRKSPSNALTAFWLDPQGARLYRRLADEHRQPSKHGWNGRNSISEGWSPDGVELAENVPIVYVENVFPNRSHNEFPRDVDSAKAYTKILEWWLPLYG